MDDYRNVVGHCRRADGTNHSSDWNKTTDKRYYTIEACAELCKGESTCKAFVQNTSGCHRWVGPGTAGTAEYVRPWENCYVKHDHYAKPEVSCEYKSSPISWDDAINAAKAKGGRLPTKWELQEYIRIKGNKPLQNEDQWTPVINAAGSSNRDWLQTGNKTTRTVWLGSSHVQDENGWPSWGTGRSGNYHREFCWTVHNKITPKCHRYAHMQKCVNGGNIVKFEYRTVEQCKEICNAMSNCEGFEFFQYSEASSNDSNFKLGDCQPQDNDMTRGCNWEYHQLQFWKKGAETDCEKYQGDLHCEFHTDAMSFDTAEQLARWRGVRLPTNAELQEMLKTKDGRWVEYKSGDHWVATRDLASGKRDWIEIGNSSNR